MVVGLVIHAEHAETIVADGQADLVAIGREALFDPYWGRHAAHKLGADPEFADWPEQYGWWLVRREPQISEYRDA
jgi:2,4-dienoyl-CoA reductase-like NADH-dependent reductase (Old Yellow Enzyme family)